MSASADATTNSNPNSKAGPHGNAATGAPEEHPHLPLAGRRIPLTTYRLQLTPTFTFSDARRVLPYLGRLGVTDVYLSPILQAVPGSTHGYDVIDHTHINADLGGREGFEEFAREAHEQGFHVIVDVVPNHMAVPTPVWLNHPMWSVLKHGVESPYKDWFDVQVDQPILMPVLGKRIGQVLTEGDLTLDKAPIPNDPESGEQWVLRYYDHVFPVAEGTESLPLSVLVERQHYRLAHWKVADEELNYRRFFDVGTLAGVRIEDEHVFVATHQLLFDLFDAGHIDGFRVDHPDGLADPKTYFQRLHEHTGGAWIAAEKILDGEESLPGDWAVAGTTGYDTAWRIQALQNDPSATLPLGAIMQEIAGDSPSGYPKLVDESKAHVIDTSLSTEVRRLANSIWHICQDDLRLRDHTFRSIVTSLRELIIQMDRYRAYVQVGVPAPQSARDAIEAARDRAARNLDDDLREALDVVVGLVLGQEVGSAGLSESDERRQEVIVRFQQTCGAVMAKGVEDTAFYRWTLLTSLTEVGGNPQQFSLDPDAFHAFCAQQQATWPATMTCGTTHDSKRGEDVRARLAAITSHPERWTATVQELRYVTRNARPVGLDGRAENLLWQTLAGTWAPTDRMTPERLTAYLTKAVREQKTWTSWTAVNTDRERDLMEFARHCLDSPEVADIFDDFMHETSETRRTCILVTKAIQMTAPGVADLYQGCEVTATSLVDPDNRRPVDFERLDQLLSHVRSGHLGSVDDEKLRLTSAIAHLRKDEPDAFVSAQAGYEALPVSSGHAVAFARTDSTGPRAITIATRLPRALQRIGGWGGQTVVLPEGEWIDIVSGRIHQGGAVPITTVLAQDPVVVLRRAGSAE